MARSGSRYIAMICGIEASFIPDMLVQYPGYNILHSHWDITITNTLFVMLIGRATRF